MAKCFSRPSFPFLPTGRAVRANTHSQFMRRRRPSPVYISFYPYAGNGGKSTLFLLYKVCGRKVRQRHRRRVGGKRALSTHHSRKGKRGGNPSESSPPSPFLISFPLHPLFPPALVFFLPPSFSCRRARDGERGDRRAALRLLEPPFGTFFPATTSSSLGGGEEDLFPSPQLSESAFPAAPRGIGWVAWFEGTAGRKGAEGTLLVPRNGTRKTFLLLLQQQQHSTHDVLLLLRPPPPPMTAWTYTKHGRGVVRRGEALSHWPPHDTHTQVPPRWLGLHRRGEDGEQLLLFPPSLLALLPRPLCTRKNRESIAIPTFTVDLMVDIPFIWGQ